MNDFELLIIESSGAVGGVGLYRVKDPNFDWLQRPLSRHASDQVEPFAKQAIEVLAVESLDSQSGTAATMVPTIQKVLSEQNLSASQLAGIGVTNGPGSFTSLRVGVVTSKTMAYALQSDSDFSQESDAGNRPDDGDDQETSPVLLAVNTLEAIAYEGFCNLEDANWPKQATTIRVWPILNAYRKQVFSAAYEISIERGDSETDQQQIRLELETPALKPRCIKAAEFTEFVSNYSNEAAVQLGEAKTVVDVVCGPGVTHLTNAGDLPPLGDNKCPDGLCKLTSNQHSTKHEVAVELNAVASLAADHFKRKKFVNPFELQADYLRQSAAEEKRDGR